MNAPLPALDFRNAYDMRGRLLRIGTGGSSARFARYAYDPDGLVCTEQLSSGQLTRQFHRDPLGRLIELDDPAFTQCLSFRLGGDAARPQGDGHILAEAVTYRAQAFDGPSPANTRRRYRYDAFGRLVGAESESESESGPDALLALSFDANGNIETLQRRGSTHSYGYESGTNRVSRVAEGSSSAEFAYAADGGMSAHGRLGLKLVRDRLTGRTCAAVRLTASLTYTYDASARQVLKMASQPGRTQLTLRGGAHVPLVEIDPARGVTTYVHGHAGLIALGIDTAEYVVGTDNRGSVRVVCAGTKVAAQFDYEPFGGLGASTGALKDRVRCRYIGQQWDEDLGLYDYGARLYDPLLARFLSPDPAHQTPSPYTYVANEPIGSVDRDGNYRIRIYLYKRRFYVFDETNVIRQVIQADEDVFRFLFEAWGPKILAKGLLNPVPLKAILSQAPRVTHLYRWGPKKTSIVVVPTAGMTVIPAQINRKDPTKNKGAIYKASLQRNKSGLLDSGDLLSLARSQLPGHAPGHQGPFDPAKTSPSSATSGNTTGVTTFHTTTTTTTTTTVGTVVPPERSDDSWEINPAFSLHPIQPESSSSTSSSSEEIREKGSAPPKRPPPPSEDSDTSEDSLSP